MPPKKRAAAKAKAEPATPAKQLKSEPEENAKEEAITKDNIIAKLKEADKKEQKKRVRLADKFLPFNDHYSVSKVNKTPQNILKTNIFKQ
jgi:hypothetical protein